MDLVIACLQLLSGMALLVIGAEGLVRGSQTLALRIGMSPLVIGLTVVAFGTSAPELVASLVAAVKGSPGLALGNVVGSNISNIGLVLASAALMRPIIVHRRAVRIDAPLALVASILLTLLLLNGTLDRLEGVLLFVTLILYTVWRLRSKKELVESPQAAHVDPRDALSWPNPLVVLVVMAGLGLLALGAHLFVDGGVFMASELGVSEATVGLTIMALGTSLPEIATVWAAARRGYSDLVVGNIVGSNLFNIFCVMGATASVVPLRDPGLTVIDLGVFIGSAALILVMMWWRARIGRFFGAILLASYLMYVAYLYIR